MRVGVDLDGCVYDFIGSLREYIHRTYAVPCEQMPPPTRWEFYEDWGYTLDDYRSLAHEGSDAGIVFGWGRPLPGSRHVLRSLARTGHSLHVVTARDFGDQEAMKERTRAWLGRHRIPFDTLTFSGDKTLISTDAFIDDHPGNVDALREVGCEGWLLDCGRADQAGHPFLIGSWWEFETKVRALDLFYREGVTA